MRRLKIAYDGVLLVSREVTLMSSSLFTTPVVLFIAAEGGASFEMYLLIIWNMIDQAGLGLVLTLRRRSAGLRAGLGG